MFYLSFNGMEFLACHGVLPEEKKTPQKFMVDIRIETDQIIEAANTDNIKYALNYVGVYETVHNIMMKNQWNLIETMAAAISTTLMEKYDDMIISVFTRVTKMNPPIEGFVGSISCEYSAYAPREEGDFYDTENEYAYEDDDGNLISFPRL